LQALTIWNEKSRSNFNVSDSNAIDTASVFTPINSTRLYSRQNSNDSFRTESTTDEDYDLSSIWFGGMQYPLDASLPQLKESPYVENSDRQSSSNCIAIESMTCMQILLSITANEIVIDSQANTSTDARTANISNLHADKIQSNQIKPISSKPFQMIWIA
jgi:hypothetical protein